LKAAYTHEANVRFQAATKGFIMAQEMVGDIMWETGGADNRQALQFINYTWDSGLDWIFGMFWNPMYLAIRDANSVLDNLDAANISEARKNGYAAEARFIRAVCYYQLYLHFGPVPLRKTTLGTELGLAKSTEEEIRTFIESELTSIVSSLPNPGSQEEYGRAHKGAALAFLCKFYLNTKQWQKCADAAKQVTNLNAYLLNPSYTAMFRVENERNKEYIWVRPAAPSPVSGPGNDWCAYVFPPGFQSDPVTGITFQSNYRNYAAQYRLYDAFYNSFAANDVRRTMIITSYINGSGQRISLLNNNDTRAMKFWPDPASIEGGGGNDIPQIRYADILMSRAEALNELNGVNAESISLINQIRARAGVTPISASDFGSAGALREHIIRERSWEFYCEGLRRQDLVRTGKLVQYALARGAANAKPHHVVFPIPQQALDSDPLLKQNAGY
ncbi:MAG: RagB/SusD family nutrient uptake outer membrane protein, partial [Chitinophagaceae bacterium]